MLDHRAVPNVEHVREVIAVMLTDLGDVTVHPWHPAPVADATHHLDDPFGIGRRIRDPVWHADVIEVSLESLLDHPSFADEKHLRFDFVHLLSPPFALEVFE